MAKKKKSSSQEEPQEAPKEEPTSPSKEKKFKPTEWASQDPDKPDRHLFLYWNKEGAIPQSKYEQYKKQVFRKK